MPYSSSHLGEATSTLITASGHNAYAHPDTIIEIKRVLLEELAERIESTKRESQGE